jgi:hypothetical protein
MRRSRTVLQRRWSALLAIVALAWQVLLPLAHAAVAPGLVPVCSSAGMKWVVAGEGTPGEGQGAALKHCPLCGGNAPLAAAAAGSPGGPLAPAPAHVAVDTRAPLHLQIHVAAPPPSRGPPLAS